MLDEILDAFASAFKEKYNKNRTGKNWPDSNKQGNICVNLLRKTKKIIFHQFKHKKPL